MNTNIHITQPELEEIEQYLSGRMEGDRLNAFREKIASEPDWKNKIETVQLTGIGIREAFLSDDLKKIDLQPTEEQSGAPGRKKAIVIALLSLAAISLVMFLLSVNGYSIFKNENRELFEAYYQPDVGLMTTMGATDNYEFEVGMVQYKSGKYKKALKHWLPLLNLSPQNDTLNFYTGSSYLALHQADKAIPYLDSVTKDSGSIFRKDAQWYLGLSLLITGKKQEAMHYIKISEHEQAGELLQDLTE